MNTKNLRTGIAAAMGGAVLLAGLLVGASFAFAQESEEPDESSLDRLFGIVEDAATESAADGQTGSLEQITADLLADIDPLVDQIRDRILIAVDQAIAADLVTADEGEALKERIAAFELPTELPFPLHRLGVGDSDFKLDRDCLRFRLGPEGAETDTECPDFEFPEGFPFGPEGFRFDGRPFGFFGDEFDGFLEDLDIDLDGILERLGSGMTLEEALADLDIDLDELLADARIDATAELDRLVEEGKLSQERADSIKEMLEGIDLSEGFPFGFRGFDLDFGDFDFGDFDFGDLDFGDFDFEGFDFEDFNFGDFNFDRFHGPRGHGFDFFGDDGGIDMSDVEDAFFDV